MSALRNKVVNENILRGKEMSRSEIREHIFKLLFSIEFNNEEEMKEQEKLYFELLDEIAEKLDEIDKLLNDLSTGWKTSRMNRVDLAILRLATYELRWDEEIPIGVAINEAVELAKKFSSDSSPSFVNGVLAKVAN